HYPLSFSSYVICTNSHSKPATSITSLDALSLHDALPISFVIFSPLTSATTSGMSFVFGLPSCPEPSCPEPSAPGDCSAAAEDSCGFASSPRLPHAASATTETDMARPSNHRFVRTITPALGFSLPG